MFNVRKFLSIEMTPTVRPEFKFSIAGGFFFFRWLFSCCRFLFIDNHHYKQPPFLPIICCRKRKKNLSLTLLTSPAPSAQIPEVAPPRPSLPLHWLASIRTACWLAYPPRWPWCHPCPESHTEEVHWLEPCALCCDFAGWPVPDHRTPAQGENFWRLFHWISRANLYRKRQWFCQCLHSINKGNEQHSTDMGPNIKDLNHPM